MMFLENKYEPSMIGFERSDWLIDFYSVCTNNLIETREVSRFSFVSCRALAELIKERHKSLLVASGDDIYYVISEVWNYGELCCRQDIDYAGG